MTTVLSLLVLLFSVIIHEISHGYVALLFGDDTAKISGRLTLNPVKHIDPLGTVILPLLLFFSGSRVLFGWAKPVPVNQYRMSDSKKGMLFVALSGPLSNYTLAFLAILLFRIGLNQGLLGYTLLSVIIINTILGTFNLLPIPPLDGSRVVSYFLKGEWLWRYQQLERYGFIIIFAALYFGLFDVVLNFVNIIISWLLR